MIEFYRRLPSEDCAPGGKCNLGKNVKLLIFENSETKQINIKKMKSR